MKILVAEHQALARAALRQTLSEVCPEATLIEATDLDTVLAALHDERDIGLMTWGLTEALTTLTQLVPQLPAVVVVFADHDNANAIRTAVDAGARAFLGKSTPHEVIVAALRMVLSGGMYIPNGNDAVAPRISARLTPRQRQVLRLLGQGKSNKEIGQTLGLTEGTVKLHVSAVLRALNVSNRTQAVLAAAHAANLPSFSLALAEA